MKRYPSIFNEALAPVTPGPSSSNTCAPARIARICRQLFGEKPVKITVEMSTKGFYTQSYFGMRSDFSFLTGIMGRNSLHPRFANAYEDAEAEGIQIESRFLDELPRCPVEYARLILEAADGRNVVYSTASTGGGTFYINAIDGAAVDIQGFDYELVMETGLLSEEEAADLMAKARMIHPTMNDITYGKGEQYGIVEIKSGDPISQEMLAQFAAVDGIRRIHTANPEHPVVTSILRKPPFETSQEMQAYQKETGLSLWQLAVEYEKALSGWSEEEVFAYGEKLWTIIEHSVAGGFQDGNDMNGIMPCRASQVKEGFESGKLLPLGIADFGAPAALSTMEHSNCCGTIVCIPTGGSSGIVPGAILGAAKALHISRDEQIKALLVAGLIGLFMSETNYFGGLGCQAEVGCAAGMAAGSLAYLIGGDGKQACDAAVFAVQSLMGLVCDPIGGLVQCPCLIRNMTAVSIAATSANAAMSGLDALIPLEEMVGAMMRVGNVIMETGCGFLGTCDTPTGRRLYEEQKVRDRKLREKRVEI